MRFRVSIRLTPIALEYCYDDVELAKIFNGMLKFPIAQLNMLL